MDLSPSIIYHTFPDRFYNLNNKNKKFSKWNECPYYDSYFGGNLKGIVSKVDYLKNLGIQTLYLNPIFKANSNHRYNTCNYYKIDPILGNMDNFKTLVEFLHSKNIKLVLDGVFNHCGTDFFAFKDVLTNNEKSKFKDWFIIKKFPVKIDKNHYQSWKNHPQLVEFNFKNPKLRNYLLNVTKFWTLKGIDGWRLDAPERIPFDFWKAFYNVVKLINKNSTVIGEIWTKADKYLKVFDGVTNYLFRDNVINFILNKKSGKDFLDYFEKYYNSYPLKYTLLSWNVLGSHDTKRIFTVLKGNIKKLKLAISLQFLLPGSPIIYYGDEIGIEGGNDPDCRRTFDWNEENQNKEIYYHYKTMTSLWKKYKDLKYGFYKKIYANNNTVVFEREYENQKILIIIVRSKLDKIDIDLKIEKPLFFDGDFEYNNKILSLTYGTYVFHK